MAEAAERTIVVGVDEAARQIAVLHRAGTSPGLFWLGGYRSDMTGAKAGVVDRFAEVRGLEATRFDYSGHGRSGGAFEAGTISRWLEETLAVFALTSGPQVLVGSSMGGWLALLLNRALRERGTGRVKALVLIAPAADMTEALMLAGFSKKDKRALEVRGFVEQPSAYGEPYRITRGLIEDGRKHLLLGKPIDVGAPVTILQGGKDRDVPREHAMTLMQHMLTDPVTMTLVPDGDHRLSREEDLRVLEGMLSRAVAWE